MLTQLLSLILVPYIDIQVVNSQEVQLSLFSFRPWEVQVSEDMNHWVTLIEGAPPKGMAGEFVFFKDVNDGKRFYRLLFKEKGIEKK